MLATDANALILPGAGRNAFLIPLSAEAGLQGGSAFRIDKRVPRVREIRLPPLVTPTSQIVGTQAVFNVITGERYKKCVPMSLRIWV